MPGVARVALQDTEVGGCPISKGERISPLLGAANTDPAEFPNPDVVDFTRNPNRHRAFGGGPHRCLGSHLARLELRLILEEWHNRIPDYALREGAQPTVPWPHATMGLDAVPLVLPPD